MPELTATFENKNNNKIPEEKMAALYATVIKKLYGSDLVFLVLLL
jgi:hypothetical protein